MDTLARMRALLAPFGLRVRGAFHPTADDDIPRLPTGDRARTLVLVGNAGTAMWPVFRRGRRYEDEPLDSWIRRILTAVAGGLRGSVVFPNDGPPFLPFQRWAGEAEALRPGPTGILMHPIFGPWHAYRGAILFAETLDLPPPLPSLPHPCDSCFDKPCLDACPAGALTARGYDLERCADSVDTPASECALVGCLARHACPVGQEYAYTPDQGAFHMAAFLRGMEQVQAAE